MNTERATPELWTALAKSQIEIENATKNSQNPHFRSKYADLAEVLNTVRPVLAKHGIAILQSTEFDGSMVTVVTVLAHSSGGIVESRASCVPAKSDAQGVGSATTYLRRYSLASMCGVAQEDDDGNAAAHTQPPAVTSPEFDSWREAIEQADADALQDIAKELSKSTLSTSDKAKLRAAYSMRKHALANAA